MFLSGIFILTFPLSFSLFLRQVLPFLLAYHVNFLEIAPFQGFDFVRLLLSPCLTCLIVFSVCSGVEFSIFTAKSSGFGFSVFVCFLTAFLISSFFLHYISSIICQFICINIGSVFANFFSPDLCCYFLVHLMPDKRQS